MYGFQVETMGKQKETSSFRFWKKNRLRPYKKVVETIPNDLYWFKLCYKISMMRGKNRGDHIEIHHEILHYMAW